jgi:hypothetical protein
MRRGYSTSETGATGGAGRGKMGDEPGGQRFADPRSGNRRAQGGDGMPTWLLVLIIVLLIVALFGGFGYYRR